MGKTNKYDVYCQNGNDKEFSFRWLGAPVSFKLLGLTVKGVVTATDSCYKTLDVEFIDNGKTITVSRAFQGFRRLA